LSVEFTLWYSEDLVISGSIEDSYVQ